MNRKYLILGITVIVIMASAIVLSQRHIEIADVTRVTEIVECVEPNTCINSPIFDVYTTVDGRLLHSACSSVAPMGISYGRTSYWKSNWCHQMRGLNG